MNLLAALLLALVLSLPSRAEINPSIRKPLSQNECRVMEYLLHQQGSNLLVESGDLVTVGDEVLAELQCRTKNGGITVTLTYPLGNLNRRPALEKEY